MEGSILEHTNERDALQKQVNDQSVEIEALRLKQCETEYSQSSSLNDLEQYGRRNSIRMLKLPIVLGNKYQIKADQ
ncbi:hypothetical protein DPMN_050619 [Dreissena polymorpha]|uniref:Uncharacterized protein n=1 Tax=Dreissena polymorpha TaxID=45954 RepID=A0A9D4CHW0_DREPO|nr:hypothetical protein DPMN_050619 [Dreissena polymorpha]